MKIYVRVHVACVCTVTYCILWMYNMIVCMPMCVCVCVLVCINICMCTCILEAIGASVHECNRLATQVLL